MKKLYIVLCTIALSVLLTACNENDGKPTVAVVNATQVLTECEGGKQAREYLEKIVAKMQQDLLELQATAERAPEDMRADAQEKLQATILDYQQKIRVEEQQILNKLSEDYQAVVDEYRKANNLSLILRSEVIVSTSPEADITKAIIENMNKKTEAENKAALAATNSTSETESPASADSKEEAPAVNTGQE